MWIICNSIGRDSCREKTISIRHSIDRLSLIKSSAINKIGCTGLEVECGHSLWRIGIDRGCILLCIYIQVTVVILSVPKFKNNISGYSTHSKVNLKALNKSQMFGYQIYSQSEIKQCIDRTWEIQLFFSEGLHL